MLQHEKRGIPSVMISHVSYSASQQYGAEDNGIPFGRRVQLAALPYSMAYPGPSLSGGTGYFQERVARPEINKVVRALTEPLKDHERNPGSVTAWQRDYDYFTPDEYDYLGVESNFPNKMYPTVRYPFSERDAQVADSWKALVGDDQPYTITFTGSSDEEVYEKFYSFAQDYHMGDGLPLIPPTRELVDEMLAATTRQPDEVIGGKVMLRKGIPTVEKVAISAVMAGAKPEYFPVILAAMEAYAEDLENKQTFFHPATAGSPYSYLLVVSGAIVEEIGMNVDAGYYGRGNDANNTIGRAFRLCLRNIGHLWMPYVDTNRHVRLNDVTYWVAAEKESAVPAGWQTYREQLGWRKDQNVVTVTSVLYPVVNRWDFSGYHEVAFDNVGQPQAWTPASIIAGARQVPGRAANMPSVISLPPAQAAAFAELGLTDITLRRNNTGVPAQSTGFGNNDSDHTTFQQFILVTGEDPGRARVFNSATHNSGVTTKHQLITGATLTQAGRDPAPPAPPKNFTVVPGTNPGTAVLTWEAPDNDGRAAITGYEVTAQILDYERWVTVPGGADARTVTLTNLDGGAPYAFRVRAIAGAYTRGPSMFGMGGRRTPTATSNVYTNIDAAVAWGAVAGRGAVASITWDAPGTRIAPTGPSEVFWTMAAATENLKEIKVDWRAPYSDGGSPITGWEYSTNNGTTWAPMNESNGRNLDYSAITRSGSYVIAMQSNGQQFADNTLYYIAVRAVNSVGYGVFAGQSVAQGANTAWSTSAVPARAQGGTATAGFDRADGRVPAQTLPAPPLPAE